MKFVLAILVAQFCGLAAILSAAWLAAHSKEGWGWFLIVGLVCSASTIKEHRK